MNLRTLHDKLSTNLSLTKNKDAYYEYFVNDDEVRREIFNDYFAFNPSLAQEFASGQKTIDEVSKAIVLDTNYVSTLDQQGADKFLAFLGTLVNKDRQTQDVLISSFIYNFVYNEIGKKGYQNPFFLDAKVELAGNLLSIIQGDLNNCSIVK